MNLVTKIVNDSELNIFREEDFSNIGIEEFGTCVPLVKNLDNLVKFYNNNYDFTCDELLLLLEDLRYLCSKRINELLVIIRHRNNSYFNNKISKYLINDYKKIIPEKNIFLTLVKYNIYENLNLYYLDENDLYSAINISI